MRGTASEMIRGEVEGHNTVEMPKILLVNETNVKQR